MEVSAGEAKILLYLWERICSTCRSTEEFDIPGNALEEKSKL